MSERRTAEEQVPVGQPETVVAAAMHYLYVERERAVCPAATRSEMTPAMREVRTAMSAAGIEPVGPSIVVYTDRHIAFRAGFVVAPEDAERGGDGLLAGVTPAIDVLHAVHVGPYERLCDTYDRLRQHLERIGAGRRSGSGRESGRGER